MRIVRYSFLALLLIGSVLGSTMDSARAQWQNLHTFSSAVSCIYFLPGPPRVGFVGCTNGSVYRTVDAGLNWTHCNTNGAFITVSSFCFKDSGMGWFTCGVTNGGYTGCYSTLDGGQNWQPTNQNGPKSCVFYNKLSHRLFLVAWQSNMTYSDDDGATWSSNPFQTYNGAAFLTDSVGMIANRATGSAFLKTNDGGLTWTNSSVTSETWQPLAIPCFGSYFALSEVSGFLYRSDDSAKTWQHINTFGANPPRSNGTLVGDYYHLIAQTIGGIYISANQGVSWNSLGGPAAASQDRRFYFANGVIFAADGAGTVYSYNLGIAPSTSRLGISIDTLILHSTQCTNQDSLIRISGPGGCESVTLLGITSSDTNNFSVTASVALPSPVLPPVRLHIIYKPSAADRAAGKDSAGTLIRVHYSIVNDIHDTTIYVVGLQNAISALSMRSTNIVSTLAKACSARDTVFYLSNPSCDTLWLTRALLGDTSHFHATVGKFPIAIAPHDSILIDVSESSITPGTFNTSLDLTFRNISRSRDTTLALSLRVLSGDRPAFNTRTITIADPCTPTDTSLLVINTGCDTLTISFAEVIGTTDFHLSQQHFPIRLLPGQILRLPIVSTSQRALQVVGGVSLYMTYHGLAYDTILGVSFAQNVSKFPTFSAPSITFPDPCANIDSSFLITNPGCDTLFITAGSILNAPDFSLDTGALPIALAPGSSTRLRVFSKTHTKESVSASIALAMHYHGLPIDTVLATLISVRSNVTPQVNIFPRNPDAGITSICVSRDILFTIRNPLCTVVTLDSLSLSSVGGTFTLVQAPAFGRKLQTDEFDTVIVRFAPHSSGVLKASLLLHLSLNGKVLDTLVAISGTGSSKLSATMLSNTLSFDTLTPCLTQTLSTYLVNTSCDSIKLAGLLPLHGKGFAILSPAIPQWIHVGDSVLATILMAPTSTGIASDSVQFEITDGKSANIYYVLSLSGFVVQPPHHAGLSAAAMKMDSLAGCSAADTTITLRNLASCDSLSISSIAINGSTGLSLQDLPNLPLTLGPGDSIVLRVHVRTGDHDRVIGSIDIRGNGFDTLIAVAASARVSTGSDFAMFVEKSRFRVKSCESDLSTVSVLNAGCSAVVIDSLSLFGLLTSTSRFHFAPMPTLPITIAPGDSAQFTFAFDAGSVGDTSATLVIGSNNARAFKQTPLFGSVTPAPKARIELLSENGVKNVEDTAAATTMVVASIKDSIPASAELLTVSFAITFNDDMLTPEPAIAVMGWSIAKQLTTRGRIELTLTRIGTAALAANTPLALFHFRLSISDSLATNISLSEPRLNELDSNYARCTLSALEPTPVLVTLTTSCGDSLIHAALSGGSILRDLTIHPNPTLSHSIGNGVVQLHFILETNAMVQVVILDALGKATSAPQNFALKTGTQSLPILVNTLAQGSYFVRVTSGSTSRVVKMSVEK
jgi:photosystem II stability/assembly factor-like uncharacterized protein